mgnify:CR=1 FL=1
MVRSVLICLTLVIVSPAVEADSLRRITSRRRVTPTTRKIPIMAYGRITQARIGRPRKPGTSHRAWRIWADPRKREIHYLVGTKRSNTREYTYSYENVWSISSEDGTYTYSTISKEFVFRPSKLFFARLRGLEQQKKRQAEAYARAVAAARRQADSRASRWSRERSSVRSRTSSMSTFEKVLTLGIAGFAMAKAAWDVIPQGVKEYVGGAIRHAAENGVASSGSSSGGSGGTSTSSRGRPPSGGTSSPTRTRPTTSSGRSKTLYIKVLQSSGTPWKYPRVTVRLGRGLKWYKDVKGDYSGSVTINYSGSLNKNVEIYFLGKLVRSFTWTRDRMSVTVRKR